ncbi:MAG: hypothetical protein JRH08_04815 [Deltaproteobacteria bacterium]|nr:hypothetical protein [Deltaproteobacteria bacterium]
MPIIFYSSVLPIRRRPGKANVHLHLVAGVEEKAGGNWEGIQVGGYA